MRKIRNVCRILVDVPLEKWTFRIARLREDSSSIHLGELYGTSLGMWPVLLVVISHDFKS